MTLRDEFLKLAEGARAYASNLTGIRINRITVRTRTWSGERVGEGSFTDSDLELPAHYPVRLMTSQEVSSSAGAYEISDIKVDHITPRGNSNVGYTLDQLAPTSLTNNVEIIYVVTGEHPGEYALIDVRNWRPFTTQLILRRRATTP